eukprot:COSAG01_NODE_16134_length_1267_cov_2.635274_2_plen_100_part_00
MKKFKGGKAKAKAKMDAKMDERKTQQEAKYREGIMENPMSADCKWQPMAVWKEAQTQTSVSLPCISLPRNDSALRCIPFLCLCSTAGVTGVCAWTVASD